jgi:hypothetical protein
VTGAGQTSHDREWLVFVPPAVRDVEARSAVDAVELVIDRLQSLDPGWTPPTRVYACPRRDVFELDLEQRIVLTARQNARGAA